MRCKARVDVGGHAPAPDRARSGRAAASLRRRPAGSTGQLALKTCPRARRPAAAVEPAIFARRADPGRRGRGADLRIAAEDRGAGSCREGAGVMATTAEL